MGRPWTEAERATLRRLHPTTTASELAKRLDRTRKAIEEQAYELNMVKQPRSRIDEAFLARLRDLNGQGYPDQEIAAIVGVERHTVGRWRRRLGLPSQARGERYKVRIKAAATKWIAKVGCSSLADVKAIVLRERVAQTGWPTDLAMREVKILELLETYGPMTRRELCEAMGMKWTRSNRALMSGNTSHTGNLVNRGLVIVFERAVRKEGKGCNQSLYALALTAGRWADVAG